MEEIKEKTKNLCAHIPVSLHNRVREEQQRSGMTLNEYMTRLITEYYERTEAITTEYYERTEAITMKDTNTRTLALQIPADLFDALDRYLAEHKLTKKEFITGLIRNALAGETPGEA